MDSGKSDSRWFVSIADVHEIFSSMFLRANGVTTVYAYREVMSKRDFYRSTNVIYVLTSATFVDSRVWAVKV